jgi:hypothetical protein
MRWPVRGRIVNLRDTSAQSAQERVLGLVSYHLDSRARYTGAFRPGDDRGELDGDGGVDGSAESLRAAEWAAAALEGWRGKYPDVSVRHDIIRGHPARVGT